MLSTKTFGVIVIIIFALCFFIKPAICAILVGCLALYIGIAAIHFLRYIKEKGTACTGIILEYESDSDGYKTPMVEFTTWDGATLKEKPYLYASTDLDKILTYKSSLNHPIPILYDPENPKKFVIANEEGFNYLVFIILVLVGVMFIVIGISELLGYIHFSQSSE